MKAASLPSEDLDSNPPGSLAEIIDNYQLEITCSKCHERISRPIGFVRGHATMLCPSCGALVFLDVSLIRQEVRRIEKQLGLLRQQLLSVLAERSQMPQAEPLPSFEEHE
jgi:hypothetical protein